MAELNDTQKDKINKSIELLQELTGVIVGKPNEGNNKNAVDELLSGEVDSNHLTQEEANETGSKFMQDISDNANSMQGMSHEDQIKMMEEFAKKRINKTKLKTAVRKAIKDISNSKLGSKESMDSTKFLESTLQELMNYSTDQEWADVANELIDSLSKDASQNSNQTQNQNKRVKTLIDPSKGETTNAVKKLVKEFEIEYKKSNPNKNLETTNKLLDQLEHAESSEDYSNYNSEEIGGISLRDSKDYFPNIKIPSNHDVYLNSDIRKNSAEFIKQTVSEIRKIKKQNLDDKLTSLNVGKKVTRRDLYRVNTDRKIFNKTILPEEDEAVLSVYVLLDFSGSTGQSLSKQIASAGISLLESFERLKIKHTIIAYDSSVSILKRGTKRTKEKYILAADGISGLGGTSTGDAMTVASELIKQDKETDILVINITDGDGSGEKEGIRKIKDSIDIKTQKVSIHGVGLTYDGGGYANQRGMDLYGKNNSHPIMNKKQFGKTIAAIVKDSIFRKREN